ncbi:hypothetical protein E2C01_053027 [Portunus trituberculatus]|uniref:Uncharacterized protein n=1 Tax=Portunus trituberculatus TaxID=210409 RepID=A0A5B7GG13_PORTR|nr:hypothetical protein [Portunus trituberculatus]
MPVRDMFRRGARCVGMAWPQHKGAGPRSPAQRSNCLEHTPRAFTPPSPSWPVPPPPRIEPSTLAARPGEYENTAIPSQQECSSVSFLSHIQYTTVTSQPITAFGNSLGGRVRQGGSAERVAVAASICREIPMATRKLLVF